MVPIPYLPISWGSLGCQCSIAQSDPYRKKKKKKNMPAYQVFVFEGVLARLIRPFQV